MKELYIEAHEELIAEYLENHPETTWAKAYDLLADKAYDRYRDKFADLVDAAKDRKKYDGC